MPIDIGRDHIVLRDFPLGHQGEDLVGFRLDLLVRLRLIRIPRDEIETQRHHVGGFFDLSFAFDVDVGLIG